MRRLRLTPLMAAIATALAVFYAGGHFEPLDRFLLDQRLSLLKRPASGSIVVVEIDARSIQALERWPWPRSIHAQALDRLVAAGAELIAIDIDFSARSGDVEDAALAAAIARAGDRLILPTFAQAASTRDQTAIVESAPHPGLLGTGTQIGSVNVVAEEDGRIRRYAVGLEVGDTYRPSLAVLLAGAGHYASQSFHIDYSIREDTIPVLSFIDVLAGAFDPAAVAGRRVIIGATAIELGDIQAVPVHGMLPGVLVQALAYETLVQGRTLARMSGVTTIIGLIVLMPAVGFAMRWRRGGWQRGLLASALLVVLIGVLVVILQELVALSLDIATWLLALAAWSAVDLIRALQGQSQRLLRRHFIAVQQRRMMRAIVETSFDGIVAVDEQRRVAHANPMAAVILGRDVRSLVGAGLDLLLPAAAIGQLRDLESGTGAKRELQLRHGDGREVDIEMAIRRLEIAPNAGEGAAGADRRMTVLTFRDVTERNRALQALREALVEAQDASRLKSEFLAAMSHELRTPLNAILGFSEIIRDRKLGAALDRYVDYAGEIHASGVRLATMVESMLDFAQAVSGRLKLDLMPVALGPVLRVAVDDFAAAATRGGLSLTLIEDTEARPAVVADANRIGEVARHLLSNAVKFTPRGGRLTVRLLQRADAAGFEIDDTGIGMTAAQIETALKPLTQVDGRLQRQHEGAGLGLSLARKLVELHGGKLAIESAPGTGTSVRVWLPLAERVRAAA